MYHPACILRDAMDFFLLSSFEQNYPFQSAFRVQISKRSISNEWDFFHVTRSEWTAVAGAEWNERMNERTSEQTNSCRCGSNSSSIWPILMHSFIALRQNGLCACREMTKEQRKIFQSMFVGFVDINIIRAGFYCIALFVSILLLLIFYDIVYITHFIECNFENKWTQ